MDRYMNIMQALKKGMDCVAGTALVLVMLLTSLDVVLRYMGRPIIGSYDMVALGGAFILGFALPGTSWDKMNITVDIIVERFPARARRFIDLFTRCMAITLFIVLGWNLGKLGMSFYKTGEATLTLGIPLFPVVCCLSLCAFAECFVLLADMVRIASGKGEQHE
jgi:TRAP-type C4-dicarboxylate transport system permease small subunit